MIEKTIPIVASYYRARYYDPAIGRFLNEDPIGFRAGTNFYSYVQGDPVGFPDPLGLKCCDVKLPDDPESSTLARMVFGEATTPRKELSDDDSHNEMLAIAFTAINRADFLASHPKQQYMFPHDNDSIAGVIVPSQYGSVDPNKKNSPFNRAATPEKLAPADCDFLKRAIKAANEALADPTADPFGAFGGVFGMRTVGSRDPGGALVPLPAIPGSNNKFYGLNQ